MATDKTLTEKEQQEIINKIEAFIDQLKTATLEQIEKDIQPTILTIYGMIPFSKGYILSEKFSINYPDLDDTIKRAKQEVEGAVVKMLLYGASNKQVGRLFYLKTAFKYRENDSTNDKPQVVIQLGANNGDNRI